MPYVIVETERTSGIKEILAVPQTWLVNKTQGVGYVHWPNVQKDEHFKALLANDRTLPHPEWKQRMCRILFRDMPSLPVAETMIRTLQMQSTIKARASSSNINFEKTAPPLLVESLPPPLIFIPKTDQQYQQSENVQELYSNVIPKQEDQEMEEEEKDPFGDDGPSLPPLQAISNEPAILDTGRKRLLQSSDEEEYDPLEDVSPLSSNPGLRVIGVEQLSSDAKRQFASFGTEQERLAGKTSVAVVKVEQLSAEVEHLFTSLGEEQEEESMQGDKASSQLFGLIRELKFMMINNQKEIKKIVSESMGKIHRTINLLVDRKDNKESDGGRDVFRIADLDEYKFEPLTTIEEAENFNERLKDEAYRKEIHDWIDSNLVGHQ
uniref:Uncharacterized protein n=1 Tax=Anopheles christyi TaxID=43041 RepID=A0A182JS25_9DIPT